MRHVKLLLYTFEHEAKMKALKVVLILNYKIFIKIGMTITPASSCPAFCTDVSGGSYFVTTWSDL